MKTAQSLLVYLGGFILLSAMILWNPIPLEFERVTLETIQDFRTPILTTLFLAATTLADFETVVFISCIFTGILLIQQKANQAISFVTAVLLGSGVMQITKLIVNRPRPEMEFQLTQAEFTSFPSGHTTIGIIMYGWILYSLTERFPSTTRSIFRGIGVLGVILPIPVSRMYLGVHWRLDSLGGIMLALGILTATRSLTNRLREMRPETRTDFDFKTQTERVIIDSAPTQNNDTQ